MLPSTHHVTNENADCKAKLQHFAARRLGGSILLGEAVDHGLVQAPRGPRAIAPKRQGIIATVLTSTSTARTILLAAAPTKEESHGRTGHGCHRRPLQGP